MTPPRKIVGVQIHHSLHLRGAHHNAANAYAVLLRNAERSADPAAKREAEALACELKPIAIRIARLRDVASKRMRDLWESDPERFKRCREGEEPWPDENPGGFEPRCTCYDPCKQHFDHDGEPRDVAGVESAKAEGWVCNCKPCPAHRAPDYPPEEALR